MKDAGIEHVFFESEGTAHEWQTWRRSLHGFAPLLFQTAANPHPCKASPRRPAAARTPIVLGPDDKPAFDDPPGRLPTPRDGIPHGKLR